MNYHNIQTDDLLNGSGIRVTLFVSGCTHNCLNCHNQQTHHFDSGIKFDEDAICEIIEELQKDYISGITLSGGDPLHPNNIMDIFDLCIRIKEQSLNKNIWCYTGYTWEELKRRGVYEPLLQIILDSFIDVIVDGKFVDELKDINYPFAGSTNQRIIDVRQTNKMGEVVLWDNK